MAFRRINRRALWAALVVVFLAAAGAGVFFLQSREAQAAERCEVTTEYLRNRGEAVRTGNGGRKVFVLGDSYTAGDVLEDRTDVWVYDLARIEDATVTADGIGGTGFVNGGSCGGMQFGTRLGQIVHSSPGLVILQGGLNDWRESPDKVASAAFNDLQELSDVPEVVVVGPINAPSRSEGAKAIDSALREAVEAQGRRYISALDWDLPYLPDRLHLTPAGHDTFAAHVAAAIRG